jgi:hypothetical protein
VPVRQWVLSLPTPLRLLPAAQPELVTAVLQVAQRVLTHRLLEQAGLASDEGHGGAVTLIRCLGSAAKLDIHRRGLLRDGVYRCGADGVPEFVEVGAPTDNEVHALLQTIIGMLEDACQVTTYALIQATIAPGTHVVTDEHDICCRLPVWGYDQKTLSTSVSSSSFATPKNAESDFSNPSSVCSGAGNPQPTMGQTEKPAGCRLPVHCTVGIRRRCVTGDGWRTPCRLRPGRAIPVSRGRGLLEHPPPLLSAGR